MLEYTMDKKNYQFINTIYMSGTLANCVDPGQMLQNTVSDQG